MGRADIERMQLLTINAEHIQEVNAIDIFDGSLGTMVGDVKLHLDNSIQPWKCVPCRVLIALRKE